LHRRLALVDGSPLDELGRGFGDNDLARTQARDDLVLAGFETGHPDETKSEATLRADNPDALELSMMLQSASGNKQATPCLTGPEDRRRRTRSEPGTSDAQHQTAVEGLDVSRGGELLDDSDAFAAGNFEADFGANW
jgi:hypothetical protein